jgi:hypothetical protein
MFVVTRPCLARRAGRFARARSVPHGRDAQHRSEDDQVAGDVGDEQSPEARNPMTSTLPPGPATMAGIDSSPSELPTEGLRGSRIAATTTSGSRPTCGGGAGPGGGRKAWRRFYAVAARPAPVGTLPSRSGPTARLGVITERTLRPERQAGCPERPPVARATSRRASGRRGRDATRRCGATGIAVGRSRGSTAHALPSARSAAPAA